MSQLIIVDRVQCRTGIRGEIIEETDYHLKIDIDNVEYGDISGDWCFGDEVFIPKSHIINLNDLKLN